MSRIVGALGRTAASVRYRIRPSTAERRIAGLGLRPADVAIDCGANIGTVTAALSRTGAYVHAFEPNPYAYAVLAERFGGEPNVELHPQAVLDRAGTARLHLHVDAVFDPLGASTGSSVLSFKGNVDSETYVEVEAVDLADFVLALDRPVKLVKLDVEGAECPIVHRLLDTGAIDRIDTVLVELHDRHIPELRQENDRLRKRLASEGLGERILTDWE
jgi:FkbM family methyltransferase